MFTFTISEPSLIISLLQAEHSRLIARANDLQQSLHVLDEMLAFTDEMSSSEYALVRSEWSKAEEDLGFTELGLEMVGSELTRLGDQMDEAWFLAQADAAQRVSEDAPPF